MIGDDVSSDSYIIQLSRGQPPFVTADIKGFVIMSATPRRTRLVTLLLRSPSVMRDSRG